MSHGIIVCEGCGAVLTSCRCMEKHEKIPRGFCLACGGMNKPSDAPQESPKDTGPAPRESIQSRRAKLAMSIVNYVCENAGVSAKTRQEMNDRLFAWAEHQLEEYAAFRADIAKGAREKPAPNPSAEALVDGEPAWKGKTIIAGGEPINPFQTLRTSVKQLVADAIHFCKTPHKDHYMDRMAEFDKYIKEQIDALEIGRFHPLLEAPAPSIAGGAETANVEDAMRFGDDVANALGDVTAAGLIDAETILRDKLLELSRPQGDTPTTVDICNQAAAWAVAEEQAKRAAPEAEPGL